MAPTPVRGVGDAVGTVVERSAGRVTGIFTTGGAAFNPEFTPVICWLTDARRSFVEVIRSWAECRRYIAADVAAHGGGRALVQLPQVRWQVRLRLTEWWCNTRGGPLGTVLRWSLQRSAVRLGYTIPINRFGPGLKLPHWGTIVVSGAAVVGADCQLHPDTLIGTRAGAPTLGDGVTVDNGAKIYGPIHVGDGCHIAPLAIVSKDVPSHTTVKGVNRHEPILRG